MKNKVSLKVLGNSLSILVLAMLFFGGSQALAKVSEPVYKALNPRGIMGEVKLVPLTPRVPDLSGKVVYCISQKIGGADIFVKKVAEQLHKYAPGVKTVFKKKPGPYMSNDRELWDETVKEADAVIYCCAA